jgi:hypothetical protein
MKGQGIMNDQVYMCAIGVSILPQALHLHFNLQIGFWNCSDSDFFLFPQYQFWSIRPILINIYSY